MKKFLLSLFVGLIGLVNFSSAGSFTFNGVITSTSGFPVFVPPQTSLSTDLTLHCDFVPSTTDCGGNGDVFKFKTIFTYFYSNGGSATNSNTLSSDFYKVNCTDVHTLSYDYDFSTFSNYPSWAGYQGLAFFYFSSTWVAGGINWNYSCTFSGSSIYNPDVGSSSCPECPTCPEINTGDILSGYILESEIDYTYCSDHGYCPIIDTGDNLGSGSYSNLYINDILHPGFSNIFVNIPDYIYWDYSIDNDTDFNLYVGSGYDQDYIDGVIDVQSYRPTSEDFTSTFVGGLILFTPYVVILLFVILVWKLIKRIFITK